MSVATHGLQMRGQRFRESLRARDAIVFAATLARAHSALHCDSGVWKNICLLKPVDYSVDYRPTLGRVDRTIRLIATLRRERRDRDEADEHQTGESSG